MHEPEIKSPSDAAKFLAEDVLNEHHAFPVAQKGNLVYIQLNGVWYTLGVRHASSLDMMACDLS